MRRGKEGEGGEKEGRLCHLSIPTHHSPPPPSSILGEEEEEEEEETGWLFLLPPKITSPKLRGGRGKERHQEGEMKVESIHSDG